MTWISCAKDLKKTPPDSAKKATAWIVGVTLGTILIALISAVSYTTHVIVNQNAKIQELEELTANNQLFDMSLEIGAKAMTQVILKSQPDAYKGLQLMRAIQKANITTVDFLLDNGAYIQAFEKCGPNGEIPIIEAAIKNMTEMIDWFHKHQIGASVNVQDAIGCSPLHYAAWNNNLKMAKLLLGMGADVNIKDNLQRRPLHFAVERSESVSITTILLAHGANIDSRNKYGKTPLFYSSKETTQILIDFGASLEVKDYALQQTPLLSDLYWTTTRRTGIRYSHDR